jgi:hypothetical protein
MGVSKHQKERIPIERRANSDAKNYCSFKVSTPLQ